MIRFIRKTLRNFVAFCMKNRPTGRGFVSLRTIIQGDAKGIFVAEGAFVKEQAWLFCPKNSKITIQSGTYINPWSKLHSQSGGFIEIGRNSVIHSFCVLYGAGGIKIGNHVRIGTHTSIIANNHGFSDPTLPLYKQPPTKKGITIGDDVWIGTGSIILDGVKIGSRCIIGAGSVVSSDVPDNTLVSGYPARALSKLTPTAPITL